MKTIVLDAGHGGHDPGALGPRGERESDVALAVVLLLGALLERDFTVIYTRTDDTFLELARRATIANDAQADAFLSIHCNSGEAGSGDGFEVFTTPGETQSDALAVDLFQTVAGTFPEKRKRMDLSDGDEDKEAKFTVLTRTHGRAILFELDFIHTAAGAAWLTNPKHQARYAEALAAGVRRHFGVSPAVEIRPADPGTVKAAIRAKALEIQTLIDSLP